SSETFCEVSPTSIDEVCEIVRLAYRYNIPLRIRGRGHTLNGSSLPCENELTIQTSNLCEIQFTEGGTVTIGAGLVLWTLRSYLNTYKYTLPVVNDGYPGPSVGGYISAGGFGIGSMFYGCFCGNV